MMHIIKSVYFNILPRGVLRFHKWVEFQIYIRFNFFKGNSKSLNFDGNKSVFVNYVKDKVGVYGEYGSGASTIYVKKNSYMKIISVENSLNWFKRMNNIDVLSSEKMVYVDLGPISSKEYSRVLTYDKLSSFREYTKSLFSFSIQPDIVMIDGRFVLASFFEVLYMTNKTVTILFPGYSYYPAAQSLIERYILPDFVDSYWAVFKVEDFSKYHSEEINKLIDSSIFSLTNN